MARIDIALGLGNDAEVIEPRKWDTYSACACVEGFDGEEHDQETIMSAWQFLIDTGTAFKLQGWYGRNAVSLIEAGYCTPPKTNSGKD